MATDIDKICNWLEENLSDYIIVMPNSTHAIIDEEELFADLRNVTNEE